MNKLNKSFDLSASFERLKGEILGGQEAAPVVLDLGGEGLEGAKSGVIGECGGDDEGGGNRGEQKC